MRSVLILAVLTTLAAADGEGAFRAGASMSLTGQPGTALLERLRDLETALAEANQVLAARDQQIAELKRGSEEEKTRSEALAAKVQYLDHARISLENARQEVADRGRTIELLGLQLAQSELARLRAERFLFEVSSDLLNIELGDAAALSAIQARVRARVSNMERPDQAEGQSP